MKSIVHTYPGFFFGTHGQKKCSAKRGKDKNNVESEILAQLVG